jgi:exodeoxyribonuclease VII small subunit
MIAELFADAAPETPAPAPAETTPGARSWRKNMPKSSAATPDSPNKAAGGAEDGPRFEEAYARLEQLVAELERGELPLETMLQRFEEGVGLVRYCNSFLKQAQLKVEEFVDFKDGQWVLKDLV